MRTRQWKLLTERGRRAAHRPHQLLGEFDGTGLPPRQFPSVCDLGQRRLHRCPVHCAGDELSTRSRPDWFQEPDGPLLSVLALVEQTRWARALHGPSPGAAARTAYGAQEQAGDSESVPQPSDGRGRGIIRTWGAELRRTNFRTQRRSLAEGALAGGRRRRAVHATGASGRPASRLSVGIGWRWAWSTTCSSCVRPCGPSRFKALRAPRALRTGHSDHRRGQDGIPWPGAVTVPSPRAGRGRATREPAYRRPYGPRPPC